jgi:CheY-like chemotaxis protein
VQSPGVGQGTTVTIELPENESAALPSAPQAAVEPSIDSLGGLRVLVVDDRLDDRELLKVILQQAGATVRTASSSMEALGTLQSWRPNLLISDLAMPQEGGFGLITKVRALEDPELRRTPAIAVTAHLGLEDRTQALQAGFEHYLMKPIERNVLLGLVGRMSVQPQT